MDLQIEGRRALVTGASSGIGAGIAHMLAREGAAIVAVGRDVRTLAELAASLRAQTQAPVTIITADLSEADAPARLAREAADGFGAIDILINAAGGSQAATLKTDDDVWSAAFALNFSAIRKLTGAFVPMMRDNRFGRVINVTGSLEPRTMNASGPAKAAVHLWAKGLAADVAPDGVTINNVIPGRIESRQVRETLHPTEESRRAFIERNIPIGYFGEPEDVAALVAFLVSPLARYITGASIPVDGGMYRLAF